MQERLQTTIPNSNKWHNEDVELKAEKYGMSKKDFILNAVDMMMSFDEIFFKKIQKYSNGLHIPEWLVMQNMIIKRIADEAAETEVFGTHRRVLDEFMMMGEGSERKTTTGEELFNILKKIYIKKYEQRAVNAILKKEASGMTINENEKALLIKYRAGKAWFESDEYREEIERSKKIDEYFKENKILLETEDEVIENNFLQSKKEE